MHLTVATAGLAIAFVLLSILLHNANGGMIRYSAVQGLRDVLPSSMLLMEARRQPSDSLVYDYEDEEEDEDAAEEELQLALGDAGGAAGEQGEDDEEEGAYDEEEEDV